MKLETVVLSMCSVLSVICLSGFDACDTRPKALPTVDSKLLDISEHKTLAEDKVKAARDIYKSDQVTLEKAKKAYGGVRAKYNAWVDLLATHTEQGTDVPKSPDYQKFTEEVGKKWAEFDGYAEQPTTTAVTRGGIDDAIAGIIKGISDAGLSWWKAKKDIESSERQKAADSLRKNYKWRAWEEI